MVTAPERDPTCVGVNVTLILQDLPAAKVAPHGFNPDTSAKSPLAVMLPMFRVALPELVNVMAFGPFVTPTSTLPNARDVGINVTAGPAGFVTVTCMVVWCVRAPETPVMVTVDVPCGVDGLAVRVRVLVVEVGFGAKAAVMPLGNPVALRVTLPLNPFTGLTVTVVVLLPPCGTLTEAGFALRLKSALAAMVTGTGVDAIPFATTTRS